MNELKDLQSLPLERKIGLAQAKIAEWYNYWDGGNEEAAKEQAKGYQKRMRIMMMKEE